jgi:tetratricopeptide (TPR) repeat protein
MDRFEEALADLDLAQGAGPPSEGDLELWILRGEINRVLGREQDALAALAHAIELGEGDPRPYFIRALTLSHMGQQDNALADFAAAVARDPSCADFHQGWGESLVDLKRYEDALEHFTRAAALAPGNPRPSKWKGWTLRVLRRVTEAIEEYEHTLALNESDGQVHHDLGVLLYRQGRIAEAREHLERAVSLGCQAPRGDDEDGSEAGGRSGAGADLELAAFALFTAASCEDVRRAVVLSNGAFARDDCIEYIAKKLEDTTKSDGDRIAQKQRLDWLRQVAREYGSGDRA